MARLMDQYPMLRNSYDRLVSRFPVDRCARIALEANIGAGKSTFLNLFDRFGMTHFRVIPEPISQWTRPSRHNPRCEEEESPLSLFYKTLGKDPINGVSGAYFFQNYAFVSKFVAHSVYAPQSSLVLERSLFGDSRVFWSLMVADHHVSQLEKDVYDAWYCAMMKTLDYRVDGFLYLRTQPEKCLGRVRKRSRSEEVSISLDYLTRIDQRLEDWLILKNPIDYIATDFGAPAHHPIQPPLQNPGMYSSGYGYGISSPMESCSVCVLDGGVEFEQDTDAQAAMLQQVCDFLYDLPVRSAPGPPPCARLPSMNLSHSATAL
eukprot:ANDGO_03176.mRNA.1 putative deoxycytidine kinase FPV151